MTFKWEIIRFEDNNNELDWIEISNETLENCFIEINKFHFKGGREDE